MQQKLHRARMYEKYIFLTRLPTSCATDIARGELKLGRIGKAPSREKPAKSIRVNQISCISVAVSPQSKRPDSAFTAAATHPRGSTLEWSDEVDRYLELTPATRQRDCHDLEGCWPRFKPSENR